jgi:protein phosphatase
MRVLGDIEQFPEVDIDTYETKPGDRWMACSDGLSGVVPNQLMENILLSKVDVKEACELLVGEALEFGAPDNVTVVLVDVVDAKDETGFSPGRNLVGSAANDVVIEQRKGMQVLRLLNPLTLLELLQKPVSFAPESEELLEKILKETKGRVRARRFRQIATYLLLIALAGYGLSQAIEYTQTRYFVGIEDGYVVIYKGIKEELGPFKFSSVYEVTNVSVDSLTDFQREALERSITAESAEEAERIISQLGGE